MIRKKKAFRKTMNFVGIPWEYPQLYTEHLQKNPHNIFILDIENECFSSKIRSKARVDL